MQNRILYLQSQKSKTSHALHLLLSLVTFGFWLPVWIMVAIGHNHHNNKIDRKIRNVLSVGYYEELSQ